MSSTLCPISAPLDNDSAWQQPFWERISKGHRTDLLNLELEFTHAHILYTRMYIKSTSKNTEWVTQTSTCQRHTRWTENAGHWRGSGRLPVIHPPTHLTSLWSFWLLAHTHADTYIHSRDDTVCSYYHRSYTTTMKIRDPECDCVSWHELLYCKFHYWVSHTHTHTHIQKSNLVMISQGWTHKYFHGSRPA